ncbi:MAG: hypothetical protein ACJAQW_000637 [Paracoccaceae bacterium]|jgi:hypothetical protein
MTNDQILLFALFATVFALLLWGKFRYDLMAFSALMAGVELGVVPASDAFSGFDHPATFVVALVLIVSAGLVRSGAVFLITRTVIDSSLGLASHIALIGVIGGGSVSFHEQRRSLGVVHAGRYPDRPQSRAQSGFIADAALVCDDPRGYGYVDRHAAQYYHRRQPRRGLGRRFRCSISLRSAGSQPLPV